MIAKAALPLLTTLSMLTPLSALAMRCSAPPTAIEALNGSYKSAETTVVGYGSITVQLIKPTKENQNRSVARIFSGVLFQDGALTIVNRANVDIWHSCKDFHCGLGIPLGDIKDALIIFDHDPSSGGLFLSSGPCRDPVIVETKDFDFTKAAKCLAKGRCKPKDLGL